MIKLSLLLIYIRHLCTRFRIDGKKAMSCRISGGKQVLKFASTSNRGGVTKTKTLENEDLRPKTRLSFRDYEN